MLDGSIWTPVGTRRVRDIVKGFETVLENDRITRMRHVKQLSFVDNIHPGATHTRFEHLLGTAALAREIAIKLYLDESDAMHLGLYGLLHDIGHPPFSHALETLFIELGRGTHNDATRQRVNEMTGDIDRTGLDSRKIRGLVGRTNPLHKIVSSPLGADKLDYTARDNYHIGLGDMSNEVKEIIGGLRFDGENLGIDGRYIEAAENFVRTMANNYRDVYFAPPNILLAHLFRKAVLLRINEGLNEDNLWKMTEGDLERELIASSNPVVGRIYQEVFSPRSPKIPYVAVIKLIPYGARNRNGNHSLGVQPLPEEHYRYMSDQLGTTLRKYHAEERIARDTDIEPWEVVIAHTSGKRMEPPEIPVFYNGYSKYLFEDNPLGWQLIGDSKAVESIDVYVKGDRIDRASKRLTPDYLSEVATSVQQERLVTHPE